MKKTKYRGYSNQSWFYCWAYSLDQAKIQLRNQSLKKFGRYNFTEFQKFEKNKWKKV